MNMGAEESTPHKKLLSDLLYTLEQEERLFYKKGSERSWWAWHIFAGIVFIASLGTAIVTGMLDSKTFDAYGKVTLLFLSVAGTAASGALNLFQFREKEALRENGRIELEDIILNAKSRLADSKSEEESRKDFHAIRARYIALEFAQHHRDVSLRSDDIKQLTDKNGA
jgi:hypothetical protein